MMTHRSVLNRRTGSLLAALTLFLLAQTCMAQRHEILSQRIASVQVMAGDNWMDLPVAEVGGRINIGFDDLTHEYTRYAYRIEHCEADWTPSEELFTSDYLQGFADGNTIDDYIESLNTYQLYTHYSLTIPNERCRLKMSGNYRLTVVDENNDGTPVLTVCFMLVEPLMGVSLRYTTNTDVDINNSHQQVEMELSYGGLNVTNPNEQIKTVVMQNGRWDNARLNARPQFVMTDGLRWQHCRDFIFSAGNEYHKFEMLDLTHPTMGIDQIRWDGETYHVFPFVNEPRRQYVYDEDANGAFIIRNSDNYETESTCDYAWVHFQLDCPAPVKGDVYLNGAWTNDRFLPEYKMEYNEDMRCYEGAVRLKQGYYNFQYLLMMPDGTLTTMPAEGDFYQTRNSYQALIYYKGTGERTDRLVGYAKIE